MEDCLFCKIVKKEIPAQVVYEDRNAMAFLDINPAAEGHVLVIPKNHSKDIFDIPERDLESLIVAVKKIAEIIKKLGYENFNILQNTGKHAGQIVHHIHFHVIPRKEEDGIFIKFPRIQTDNNSLEKTLKKLVSSSSPKEKPEYSFAKKEKPRKNEKDDWEELDW